MDAHEFKSKFEEKFNRIVDIEDVKDGVYRISWICPFTRRATMTFQIGNSTTAIEINAKRYGL